MNPKAQKIWDAFCGELIVEPTDDMREALVTAIREIACEYNYQNFGEGTDLILDMNSLFELADELEQ